MLKARARLEMREKASQQDAQDVVEIMKYSLLDTFSDNFGNLDFQRSQHGSGMSSRAQVRIFSFTKFTDCYRTAAEPNTRCNYFRWKQQQQQQQQR